MAVRTKKPPPPTADQVRRDLIRWFYDQNKKGRAAFGMQDLCKGIKDTFGHKGPVVKGHLTYLVDLGYIHKDLVQTRVTTGRTTRDQARVTYRIKAKGIEFMEGKSEFSDRERYPGINITATGGSSIVLGDGNVVNSNYRPLYEELDRLRQSIVDSSELNDSDKLTAAVSIETVKDQLALPTPDRGIVERAWQTASRLCTTATLTEYAARLGAVIAELFR